MALKVALILAFVIALAFAEDQCPGKQVGEVQTAKPGIKIEGKVFVKEDSNCFDLCGFTYDYEAPDMYFWCDASDSFSKETGFKLESKEYKLEKINKYIDAKTTVCLPKDKKIQDCKVFGLYCFQFSQIFATAPINL